MSKSTSYFYRSASTIALAIAAVAVSQAPAWAQDAALETVVVTGSHVISAFNSPTPVNVVDDARMQSLAVPNVSDALNQLPSFRATTTQTSALFRASGTIGGNNVDLRGLGTSRTLVLVDGRRFVPEGDSGSVDLNAIPSSLVKRTEIVTGGASAQYGADAVAGVVNLILDTKFEGFHADLSGGISDHGDDANTTVSAKYGDSFAGGRGHFLTGIEYQKNWGAGVCETRDWCAKHTNYVPNPGYVGGVSTNGLPATIVMNNVNFVFAPNGVLLGATQTVGGVSTALGQQVTNTGATALPAALQGLQFNNGATALVPFQFGNLLSGNFMQGGDPAAGGDWGYSPVPSEAPTAHISALAHADYDLTDSIQAFGEFLYSHVDGGPVTGSFVTEAPDGGAAAGISINNPYIVPAIRAQILAANPNITAIKVNTVIPLTGPSGNATSSNNTYRFVTGLKGDVFGDWHWDVSYEFGETTSYLQINNTRLASFDIQSAAAITPPAGYTGPTYTTPQGAPVICSSTATNPTDGCVPVDFFGGNVTPANLAKYEGSEWQTRTMIQHDIAGNFRGSPFSMWDGPVEMAIGGEYRYDSASGNADPATLAGAFQAAGATALGKVTRNVTEGYLEANIPLFANRHLVKSMTVDLTGRETHYDTFGDAQPWKIGFEYEPNDTLLFRFTKSSDIRSPTAFESNPNVSGGALPLNDPFGGGNHSILTPTGGNANLHLETGNTNTAGIVLKPDFIPNFNVSFDWYDITVKGAIDTVSAANILQACNLQNLLCNLITFSGAFRASPATQVFSNFQNLSKVHAEGYELTANYTIPDVWNGALNFDLNANYVLDLKSVGATGLITRMNGVTGNAGSLTTIAGVPSYKIDAVISYVEPMWSVTTHIRYVPQGILDPTKVGPGQPGYNINLPNSQNINMVGSALYDDISGSVKLPDSMLGFGEKMELYGAINNVADTNPPKTLRLFGNPLQFDTIGRTFRLGIRANL